jgi:outer membrane protein OmpA-like peptidoglycan-associated protein
MTVTRPFATIRRCFFAALALPALLAAVPAAPGLRGEEAPPLDAERARMALGIRHRNPVKSSSPIVKRTYERRPAKGVDIETGSAAPETGSAAPETGSAAPETGSAAPETGSAAPETGSAAPVTGSAAPETGSAAPETGSAAPETGSAAPVTGSAAPVTGSAAPVTGSAAPVTGSAAPVTGAAAPVTGAAAPVTGADRGELVDVEIVHREDGSTEVRPFVALPILFVVNSDELLDEISRRNVEAMAGVLKDLSSHGPAHFAVQGHTSAEGARDSNQILSERRAARIEALLAAKGVEAKTLSAVGLGEDASRFPEDAPEPQRQEDRRVLIVRMR